MNVTMTLPDETYERIQRARRSDRFIKVPSTSSLLRRFIEEGLAREEQQNPPEAVGAAPGEVTTTKGTGR